MLTLSIRRLEFFGMFFIAVVGTALHFTYELSGRNLLVAVFSAVNESVWEHLKLVFWPAIMFALIEIAYLRKVPPSFLPAKAVSVLVMPALIVTLFYASKLLIGGSLAFDIFIFYLSIVVGQLTSIKILEKGELPQPAPYLALLIIIGLAIAFITFTFDPPRIFLFQDPVTGAYGLVR